MLYRWVRVLQPPDVAAYREQAPFAFTGTITSVEIEVAPTQPRISDTK
jgi:hypothetical protein